MRGKSPKKGPPFKGRDNVEQNKGIITLDRMQDFWIELLQEKADKANKMIQIERQGTQIVCKVDGIQIRGANKALNYLGGRLG